MTGVEQIASWLRNTAKLDDTRVLEDAGIAGYADLWFEEGCVGADVVSPKNELTADAPPQLPEGITLRSFEACDGESLRLALNDVFRDGAFFTEAPARTSAGSGNWAVKAGWCRRAVRASGDAAGRTARQLDRGAVTEPQPHPV